MSNFRKDLATGQAIEAAVAKRLEDKGFSNFKFGNNKDYDIIAEKDSKLFAFEVKYDRMAERTGNVAIEVECNNKPSGVTASKASFFVYVIEGIPYAINTNRLREFISDRKNIYREVYGGDGNRSRMKLVKKDLFIQQCKVIGECSRIDTMIENDNNSNDENNKKDISNEKQ